MGNICSSSANKDKDAFSTPGRPLGTNTNTSASVQNRASVPNKVTSSNPSAVVAPSSPGRTLGSAGTTNSRPDDARSAAAKAAEERANASAKPGGKLKTQLDAQKRKTQGQTLNEGSAQERAVRTADENAQVRNWN